MPIQKSGLVCVHRRPGTFAIDPNHALLKRDHSNPALNFTMDVTKAVGTYIDKMISNPAAIKVLLLDSHIVCTQ